MISIRKKNRLLYAGIDIGSITTKAVIVENGKIIGTKVDFTGYHAETAGEKVFEFLLKELNLDSSLINGVVATGYGRNRVKFADKAITEITCHAAGAFYQNKNIQIIIDIGGQDSKVIIINTDGKVKDFAMNDKCAAGTGRFLEVMARTLEVNLDEFGIFSSKSVQPSKISSTCTVFAESEIISLISKRETRENIIAGIHESVASRVSAMAKRMRITGPIMMTGGVAKNSGVVKALENKINMPISISDFAQVNGAIGAAVMARNFNKN